MPNRGLGPVGAGIDTFAPSSATLITGTIANATRSAGSLSAAALARSERLSQEPFARDWQRRLVGRLRRLRPFFQHRSQNL